ncbi:hypothetical protein DL769_004707 [Monosporascus sp. CRB-8-3]|nr:hypothetical protein DL769_004707 [Monosporascus sp. CRB-8-3]
MCSTSDRTNILRATALGRGIDMAITWYGTLTERIDNAAVAQPDCVAVNYDNGRSLTYGQTMARTRQTANHLRTYSGSPGSSCSHAFGSIADAVCCIRKLAEIENESRPDVLTCQHATEAQAQILATGRVPVLMNIEAASVLNDSAVVNVSKPPFTADIPHTSGPTGAPKGISREIKLQQSPLGFDLLDKVFLALASQGTIIMVGKEDHGGALHIAQLVVKEHHILKHGQSWRFALSAGEKMGHEVCKAFRELDVKSSNLSTDTARRKSS